MIGYLDTSAFVPLLVAERASPACRRFWDDADTVVTATLLHVETAAAPAQAHRLDRLTDAGHNRATGLLDDLWGEFEIVEVDQRLVDAAAVAARRVGLRGYDSVHCAAAQSVIDTDLVAAAGDRRLLDTWHELGIATYDVNAA